MHANFQAVAVMAFVALIAGRSDAQTKPTTKTEPLPMSQVAKYFAAYDNNTTIKNGKIVPTGKVAQVSPEAILQRRVERWKCDFSRDVLIMESDGLLTVNDGVLALTEAGIHAAQR